MNMERVSVSLVGPGITTIEIPQHRWVEVQYKLDHTGQLGRALSPEILSKWLECQGLFFSEGEWHSPDSVLSLCAGLIDDHVAGVTLTLDCSSLRDPMEWLRIPDLLMADLGFRFEEGMTVTQWIERSLAWEMRQARHQSNIGA